MTLLHGIHRKITIEAPVKRILEAVEQISQGDFDIQIPPLSTKKTNEFDEIIDGINRMAKEL